MNARTALEAVDILEQRGIRTFADLDEWRNLQFAAGRGYSRYSALKEMVGEDAAISILHELSLRQCCPPIRTCVK